MKKASILFTSSFLMLFLLNEQIEAQSNVYGFSIPKIEGGNQSFSDYQGKKVIILTLPVQQSAEADTLLYCLDTLASIHISELKVIAVPSYEDGFTISQRDALTQWYRSKLGNYIIISDGLYTRKISGTQQHPLFKWMTTVTLNEVFNVDVEGPAYKFFLNTSGELYGVIGPEAKISGRAVQNTLLAQ